MKFVKERRRAIGASFVLAVLAAAMLFAGCQAPLEQKKGALGEFCNGGDNECRPGLVCQQGICASLNNSNDVCGEVCDRFDACGAALDNCYNNCLATLQKWAKSKTEQYQTCYTDDVTCEEIRNANKPQNICYGRLELKDSRVDRCKEIRDVAQKCLDSSYEDQIGSFMDACKRKGRTVSDQTWSDDTDKCADWADQLQCGNMFNCINNNFSISKDFPTSKPN